jgi:phosphatidylinositol alpha-mannosyltransferase
VRILLVTPYDITLPGGVTSHVLDLAHQFHEMGHEATLVGPAGGGVLPQNAFTHHIGGTFRFPSPGDAARVNLNPLIHHAVRAFLKGRDFDVIHTHEPFLPYIGPSFLREATGTKVGTFHTWRRGSHVPYAVFRPLIRHWNRFLDGRIAVSNSARSTINRYVPAEYEIIPNGVDFGRFATPGPPIPHLVDDRPTILFVGRLEARKGIPYLLRAFKKLKTAIPQVRLVIVGEGGLREEYERLAAQLELRDLRFEGYVPPEYLPSYYQRADVVCQPSTVNESFGITLLEAMSAGTPVVATNIDGFSTLGQNEVTGVMVPPKDAESLAAALERVLDDKALAERLVAAAQTRARLFSWERVAEQLVDYYKRSNPANGRTKRDLSEELAAT